nr:hypothetical protein [Candidatus Sigynarchaeota archaeon]
MHVTLECKHVSFHAFWSKDVNRLIDAFMQTPGKAHATHHELGLDFINDQLFGGGGIKNSDYRQRGKVYPDLIVPSSTPGKEHEVVEFKLHTSEFRYLRHEVNALDETFQKSDYLHYSYLLQRAWRDKSKALKTRGCIYYLVVVVLPRSTMGIPTNELMVEIRMGAEDLTKKLAEKSGIDADDEELLGVDNIIKVVELERILEQKDQQLEQKDQQLEQKDQQLEQRDQQLEQKDQQLEKKEKEIERLRQENARLRERTT